MQNNHSYSSLNRTFHSSNAQFLNLTCVLICEGRSATRHVGSGASMWNVPRSAIGGSSVALKRAPRFGVYICGRRAIDPRHGEASTAFSAPAARNTLRSSASLATPWRSSSAGASAWGSPPDRHRSTSAVQPIAFGQILIASRLSNHIRGL
jgi:hypothetical protein